MSGRVVVVTGASGGIGRASARVFARPGDRLALLARGQQGLDGAAHDVRARGGEAITISVDMADADARRGGRRADRGRARPIDVWVNDAFISVFAPFKDIGPDEYRRVTEVSYLGYVYGTMAALKRMLPRDRGTDRAGRVGAGLPGHPAADGVLRCQARHPGLHESLRCRADARQEQRARDDGADAGGEHAAVLLGAVAGCRDQAQPVPPIYQPEVAARAVAYAADHPRRREYWVGGSTVATLAVNALVPAVLDWYLSKKGFASQQTGEPKDPDQPVNLWDPADGPDGKDFGAHGAFDAKAVAHSSQQWVSHHYAPLAAVTGAVVAGAGVLLAKVPRK